MHLPFLMAVFLAAGSLWQGCIRNDIPFPRVQENIVRLRAVGESREADIDSTTLTATVYLDEVVDICNVSFSEFEWSNDATVSPNLLEGTYDLSQPLVVTLERWQVYQWVILGRQEIERYFTVAGQIGETDIDPVGRRIMVRVPETADLTALEVTSVRLGPPSVTSLSPDIVEGGTVDLAHPLDVEVTMHGRKSIWTIYAEKTRQNVFTSAVDPWSRVVWLYGICPADQKGGFQYRLSSETEWKDIDTADITQNEGNFTACVAHLEPLTKYVFRAFAGEEYGQEIEVETQATEVLPDGSFDQWWLNNKVWCPWAEGGSRFWDTGNTGAATLGQSNVQPSDDTPTGSGQSAKLETRFVGIGTIGKLAAGSIYTGSFVKVDGTNGILDFGRPWTVRPTRLRGYYKYKTALINYMSADYKYLEGRPDTCHIYVAVTDWPEPFQIRTNPKNRQLFDKNSPEIIGYGELVRGNDTDGWQEFEISLDYRSTSRVPTYIQITCAASKYGDFFTGGAGATLWVDQFSLDYDY